MLVDDTCGEEVVPYTVPEDDDAACDEEEDEWTVEEDTGCDDDVATDECDDGELVDDEDEAEAIEEVVRDKELVAYADDDVDLEEDESVELDDVDVAALECAEDDAPYTGTPEDEADDDARGVVEVPYTGAEDDVIDEDTCDVAYDDAKWVDEYTEVDAEADEVECINDEDDDET
ncbi:hypothetical protein HK405_003594 [Cladochytrium tenue]|nr:hypothetical protein HK405_003594 [Cladochytrium tenue]